MWSTPGKFDQTNKFSRFSSCWSSLIFSTTKSLFSYNINNRYENWKFDINSTSTPIIDGNNVFLVSRNGFFVNIDKNSGKIIKTEEWGLRPLSYKIKNNKRGIYFHIKFEGIGKTIDELERAGNIDQMLIRYLTVKVKKFDLETNYFNKTEDTEKKFEKGNN